MRYLSVCSGIEAASVAWHHLGWEPVAFSEIEPFPSAVLAHRFPNVPNYGDMTKHATWRIEPGTVDVLVGGTPCQSFSVAGLRQGLSDPRGGLMLTYLEIARRLRPRWVVWENVPGVLSSNGGRDFGSFLGALGEVGYGWAYRVLDAQWVRTQRHPRAVPQRRRRVFVVGCLGDWTAAAKVLFERESVCRNPAESAKTRKIFAAAAEAGAGAGCYWNGENIASALTRKGCDDRMPDKERLFAVLQPAVYRWQNDRDGLQADDASAALRASAGTSGFHEMNHAVVVQQPVPFTKSKLAQSTTDNETWVDGQVNPTLSLFDSGDTRATTVAVAFAQNQLGEIRTGDISGTLNTNSNASDRNTPMAAVAFKPLQDPISSTDGSCFTQSTDQPQAVSVVNTIDMQACKGNANVGDGSVSPTLCKPSGSDVHAVAHSLRAEGFDASEDGTGRGTPLVPQAMTVRRLTPRECERLQGFPDDWTLIPWRKKPADECPDGPRYRALGNSMAVNCMEWIGERIARSSGGPRR